LSLFSNSGFGSFANPSPRSMNVRAIPAAKTVRSLRRRMRSAVMLEWTGPKSARLSALAMTVNAKHTFPDARSRLATRCARVVHLSSAPLEGVGNAGCPLHPRPRVHFVLVERTRVTTSTPESPGIPARNGFNGFLRALVSAKSGRMCERAVLTNRPSLDLSPFVLEGQEPAGERGTGPVSSSTRTVAWA
jgi:hypothetical protein